MELSRTDLKLGLTDRTVLFDPRILPERNICFLNNTIKCNISSRKKTSKDFNVYGSLFLKIKYECVRCLEDKIVDHNLPFNLTILCSDKKIDKKSYKFDFIQLKENETHIDLSIVFADIIALAQPIKPLCSSNCKGICIICGKNKNEKQCSCTINHNPNVWDDLKKLNIK